ncbi:hypothetical protein ACFSTE_09295 [Aquimarina hainanensis]|uniref:Holliday junction resolvase n=1 Tax=Aquimarina hainanensis TaxID=1578017 RepID=A0ABW5N679_9FLAO
MKNKNELALVLYPSIQGMGYLICESPKELVDYGIAKMRPLTNDKYVNRLLKFMRNYKPSLIIVRGYEFKDYRISKRVKKMIDAFVAEANKYNLPVRKYSRTQIKEVFKQFGADTKYTISKTISSWYPELAPKLPSIRKNYEPEHYRMMLFDVFALMLTDQYLK